MITFKKALYSALVFFGTLIVLSVGYAAWTTMGHVSSGNPLTATSWNALVDNIADLDSRWSRVGGNIAFTGGNVGIGTTNLGNRLTIAAVGNGYSNGALKITNFDGTFATYLTNAAGGFYISQDGITDHVVINSSGNVTVNGGVTASKLTTSAAWTAVSGNATWTSTVTCRRIGSFLQLNGQIYTNPGVDVSGWPVATFPSLPPNCRPSIFLNYISGTCWATSTASSACLVGITTSGVITVHNSNAFYAVSFPGSYPAD